MNTLRTRFILRNNTPEGYLPVVKDWIALRNAMAFWCHAVYLPSSPENKTGKFTVGFEIIFRFNSLKLTRRALTVLTIFNSAQ